MNDYRIIFYHKQNTSARLRFLKFESGSVCAFEPLPALSQLIAEDANNRDEDNVVLHPAQLKQNACRQLGLDVEALKVEAEYHARVDSSNGTVQVYLTELTTVDPPFEQAVMINAEFIDLTQARSLSVVELELLRKAYEHVMTG